MAAPKINSIVFDGSNYAPGATITVTVAYSAGTSPTTATQTLTGTVVDTATQQSGTLTQQFTIQVQQNDPTSISLTDTGGRSWTKVSDSNGTAKFTAVA